MTSNSSKQILNKLYKYLPVDPKEKIMRQQLIYFIENNENCFSRNQFAGHITGSAWIVDQKFKYVLLTHHTKLNRWLQLGGHSDGEANTLIVALREANEESGLKSLKPLSEQIFDLDIHTFPKKGLEPSHLHYDIRFLLTADMDEPLIISNESKQLAWIKLTQISKLNSSQDILRMVQKTTKL